MIGGVIFNFLKKWQYWKLPKVFGIFLGTRKNPFINFKMMAAANFNLENSNLLIIDNEHFDFLEHPTPNILCWKSITLVCCHYLFRFFLRGSIITPECLIVIIMRGRICCCAHCSSSCSGLSDNRYAYCYLITGMYIFIW